jgi:hypothetical protein
MERLAKTKPSRLLTTSIDRVKDGEHSVHIKEEDDETALEIWKWALHEDLLFQSRSLLFVAIQALLFAGLGVTYEKTVALKYVFILAGTTISVLWLFAMKRQYLHTINEIKTCLCDYGEDRTDFFGIYSKIAAKRAGKCLPGLNQIIGGVLPCLFLVIWIAALALH